MLLKVDCLPNAVGKQPFYKAKGLFTKQSFLQRMSGQLDMNESKR